MYPTESRKILQLPKLYCHTTVISTQIPPIPVHDSTLTGAEFLLKVALNVRKGIKSISETRARQVIPFSNSLPDVQARQRPPGLYELEWGVGWGKAEWVRVSSDEPAGWDGLGYVMPEREILASEPGNAEVEIVLGLRTEVMARLCKE
jgi:hypothetical protein